MNETETLALLGYGKLKNRFNKIDPLEYYASYSGGNDSHLGLWYIKKNKLPITIVSVNTLREHVEIKDRMYENSDVVLYPTQTFEWVNEHYGMPCFSKQQDEYIRRYQGGNRSQNTMNAIMGLLGSKFQLNVIARKLTLTGQLHKVSAECCTYTKKKPLHKYEKETGLKPIIFVRGSESAVREAKYRTCLSKNGVFTPLYDLNNQIVEAMYEYYEISKPKVYNHVSRTSCIGCPYGRNIESELKIATPAQKKYAISSFKESYDVKGVNYKDTQMTIDDYETESNEDES